MIVIGHLTFFFKKFNIGFLRALIIIFTLKNPKINFLKKSLKQSITNISSNTYPIWNIIALFVLDLEQIMGFLVRLPFQWNAPVKKFRNIEKHFLLHLESGIYAINRKVSLCPEKILQMTKNSIFLYLEVGDAIYLIYFQMEKYQLFSKTKRTDHLLKCQIVLESC